MMERKSIRMPGATCKAAEAKAEAAGYPNFSAFIREIIRRNVSDAQIRRFKLEGYDHQGDATPAPPSALDLEQTAKQLQDRANYFRRQAMAIRDGKISREEAQYRILEADA